MHMHMEVQERIQTTAKDEGQTDNKSAGTQTDDRQDSA